MSAVALRYVNVNVNANEQQPPPQAGDAPSAAASSPSPAPPAQQQQQQQAQYSLLLGTEAGELGAVLVRGGPAEEPQLELAAFVVRAADAFSKCAPADMLLRVLRSKCIEDASIARWNWNCKV